MDVKYFFKQRLAFIDQFYTNGTATFRERKRLIEAGEEPFVPTYSEDAEPDYMTEWSAAVASIKVVGAASLSMLAAALHVYFQTWTRESGRKLDQESMKLKGSQGWLAVYIDHFSRHFSMPFDQCPVDMGLLREIILARNSSQHNGSIWQDEPSFNEHDLAKRPLPYFVDDDDLNLLSELDEGERKWMSKPAIDVTPEKMAVALKTVEDFADWFESIDIPDKQ